jgi:hypothetical protein
MFPRLEQSARVFMVACVLMQPFTVPCDNYMILKNYTMKARSANKNLNIYIFLVDFLI